MNGRKWVLWGWIQVISIHPVFFGRHFGNIYGMNDEDDDPTFQVAVINTEDNTDYTPPKGVKGEYDRLNEIRSKC